MSVYLFAFGCVWTGILLLFFVPLSLLTIFADPDAPSDGVGDPATVEVAQTGTLIFSVFWLVMVMFFLAVGVAMIWNAYRAMVAPRRELYAVTNQRGLVVSPFHRLVVVSIPPRELLGGCRRDRRGGLSTLDFGTAPSGPNWNGFPTHDPDPSFKNVADAKGVEDLIYETFGRAHLR